MKSFWNKYSNNILIMGYCLIISFIILLFTSKNSFLYPFNDWLDANAFFTVGKSMVRGLVPYRDLFEQKGPFLYLIYGIGSLISYTSFTGVFILEVISWSIALYFLYKTCILFVSNKSSIVIVTLFISIICTCFAFTHGGSAEEFTLPMFMVSSYYFLRHYKKQELKGWEMVIIGVMAGLVMLIKYTMLGFWIGITLAIFYYYIKRKKFKKAIIYPLLLLSGMVLTLIPFLIYFGINHAIYDFIKCYFLININNYGEKVLLIGKLSRLFSGSIRSLIHNIIPSGIILIGFMGIKKLDINKEGKVWLIIIFVITLFFIFFGLKFYRYYVLFLLYFSFIGLIVLFKFIDSKVNNWIIVLCIGGALLWAWNMANYKEFRNVDKEDLFLYKYSEIIRQDENATLLNAGGLDAGLYTITGIIPNTYYFQKQNFRYKDYPENEDELRGYIKNKDTMYVLYYTRWNLEKLETREKDLFNNYELIDYCKYNFENKNYKAYLFRVKEC